MSAEGWAIIIAALALAAVQIITALGNRKQNERIIEKAAVIEEKTAVIEGHVNSQSTAATLRNEALQNELILLRADMADKKSIAALLAQSKAQSDGAATVVPIAPVVVAHGAAPAAHGDAPATEATLQKVAEAVEKQP